MARNVVKKPEDKGRYPLTPVRQPLGDQVIAILKERLQSGEFQVGQRFPSEPELMEQLGVGRTTVREAVRVLEHAGLLEVRQGDGTYVRSTAGTDRGLAQRLERAHVLEVFAVRRALDLEMVRLAALARSDADLAKLREVINRMRGALEGKRDPKAFAAASIDLHLTVAGATKNEVLTELYSSFAVALRGAIEEVAGLPGVMEACLSRHERLVDALTAQEPDTAQAITGQYLDRVTALLEEVLAAASIGNRTTAKRG